jgi:hypothetical protein
MVVGAAAPEMPLSFDKSVIAVAVFETIPARAAIVSASLGSESRPKVFIEPSVNFRSSFLEPGPSFKAIYCGFSRSGR